jgi:hypothetical protein
MDELQMMAKEHGKILKFENGMYNISKNRVGNFINAIEFAYTNSDNWQEDIGKLKF